VHDVLSVLSPVLVGNILVLAVADVFVCLPARLRSALLFSSLLSVYMRTPCLHSRVVAPFLPPLCFFSHPTQPPLGPPVVWLRRAVPTNAVLAPCTRFSPLLLGLWSLVVFTCQLLFLASYVPWSSAHARWGLNCTVWSLGASSTRLCLSPLCRRRLLVCFFVRNLLSVSVLAVCLLGVASFVPF